MEQHSREKELLFEVAGGAADLLARADASTLEAQGIAARLDAEKREMQKEWRAEVADAQRQIGELNGHLADQQAHIARLEAALAEVTGSLSWRMTRPLRAVTGRLGGSAAPPEEPPAPEAAAAGAAPPAEEPPPLQGPLRLTPEEPYESLPAIQSKVSFVLPTYNAGEGFDLLLDALIWQQGIAAREVIVVDSGSTDGTPELAKQRGAKVLRIPQAEFSHSHARNIGAEAADGSFVVFLTQDAMPDGLWWARRFLHPLLDDTVSAVSCAEMPPENADLFYRMSSWHHTRLFVAGGGLDRVGRLPEDATPQALRENASLNNIACGMRMWIHKRFPFRGAYGEDLDLGLRLLREGARLGLLGSVQVIHGHARPAHYYARRAFVDTERLLELLPPARARVLSRSAWLCRAALQYGAVARLRVLLQHWEGEQAPAPEAFCHMLAVLAQACLHADPAALLGSGPAPSGDEALDEMLNELWRVARPQSRRWDMAGADSETMAPLSRFLQERLRPYLASCEAPVDAALRAEVSGALLRFFAWECLGTPLAELNAAGSDETLKPLTGLLRQGV